jgi:GNAT superfamily N-acetyltransferase
MDTTWVIRPAQRADMPAVAVLSDALFQEDSGQRDPLMNHDWAKEHGEAYFTGLLTREDYTVLVAENEETVIGYLAGSMNAPSDLRPVLWADLESMCVARGRRGHGVGAGLAQAFLDWAQAQGAVWVTVTAYAANLGALAFYTRQGFMPHTTTLGLRLA